MSHRPLLILAAASLLAACTTASAPVASGSVKEQMHAVVDPASSSLFSIAGDADPANGPDALALSSPRWAEAAKDSAQLKAVAVALTDKAHAKDAGQWMTYAKQMGDLADAALKSAKAKDGAGLSTAANDLSDNCAACHGKYKAQTAV